MMAGLFDPRQNLIEACKELLMVEDHLLRPDRRCPDCVTKHLLKAQAFADELYSLDPRSVYAAPAALVQGTVRDAFTMLEAGMGPAEVAAMVRQSRKPCMAATTRFKLAQQTTMGALRRRIFTKRNALYGAAVYGAWRLLKR